MFHMDLITKATARRSVRLNCAGWEFPQMWQAFVCDFGDLEFYVARDVMRWIRE